MFILTKVSRLALLFSAVLVLWSPGAAAQKQEVVRTVCIDAGHGGHDPGAVYQGGKYKEKDVNLAVALKLGKLIKDNYPSVKVVYTRTTDVFVDLDKRSAAANNASADLFISIHANANGGTPGSGTETIIMGTAKTAANLEVAMRENAVISYESDYTTKYQGYEPNSPESFIIFSLMQYAYREQSLAFANMIQNHYRSGGVNLRDRGVGEAGVLVLWQATMPAVLTEMGFINNPTDLQLLITPAGQDRYARCLFNAFSAYKAKADGGGTVITIPEKEVVAPEETTLAATPQEAPAGPGKVTYAVQIRISPKSLSDRDPVFGVWCGKVFEKKIGNLYKYYVEECESYQTAAARQSEVRRTVKDAFVVAFLDGAPITVAEAQKIQKK